MVQTLAFIPSPLLPSSAFFGPLMAALGAKGFDSVATTLTDDGEEREPWHLRHVRSAADGLRRRMAADRPYLLVGYSGSGPLLPYIAGLYARRPRAYVFVDAGLPHPGGSRMEEVGASLPPDAVEEFAAYLEGGGAWPPWTDDDVAPVVPDPEVRSRLLDMVVPRGKAFWMEPLPGLASWPDAPVAYLRLSEAYEATASEARSRGWPVRSMEGAHFDPFARPEAVAAELVALVEGL